MKTLGLIGGMSWESTVPYYQLINRGIAQRLGGLHSASLILHSVDFREIEVLQHAGEWDEAGRILADIAQGLERVGAECIVICTNTMHKLAPIIEERVDIPILHIADATGAAIQDAGLTDIALLGTQFTMEGDFYRGRLEKNFGLRVRVPNEADRKMVHSVIYDELCKGILSDDSRRQYLRVISQLVDEGAQGVILGCTEIGLLVDADSCDVPRFDTTELHAAAAVDFALS